MRRLFILFVMVCVLAGGVLGLNFYFYLHASTEKAESLIIEPGMTLNQIINLLHERGIISNPVFFKVYAIARGAGKKIHAGEYEFSPAQTPVEILTLLLKGDFARLRITIPEGWDLREIAEYLERMGLVSAADFISQTSEPPLEGYLFPDTYEIYRPKGAQEVIRTLVGRFHEVFDSSMEARAAELGMPVAQVVTLASIIEKETGVAEERPLISSVFHNRLSRGIALASDPTVIYGIANFSGNLTRADLERPGPYNTYLNPGLPPTPIANPGRASLQAALYPAETDYLYFVSRNDGTHQFSRTIEEHGAAVSKFQRSRSRETEPSLPIKIPPTSGNR